MTLFSINNILEGLKHNCNILEYNNNNNYDFNYNNLTYQEKVNLLLSFNFALYNFYMEYYNEDFQMECILNNKYILNLENLENQENLENLFPNLIEYDNLFLFHTKKIHNKYICSISTINDTSLIKKVEMYVSYKIKESITLENTSEFFHLNKIYFCSKFKEETGINFMLYVQHERIKKSKFLLSEDYLTIEEISQECGFNSAGYFSRVFKKIEGISPKEFRKAKNL